MRRSLFTRAIPALPMVALITVALLPPVSCGRVAASSGANGAAAAPAKEPAGRLSQLLRRGAQPGELTIAERAEIERLVGRLLPRLDGPLARYRWRVAYDDLPIGDFVNIDLMEGPGEAAPRALWVHLLWRGALSAAERDGWALRLGGWPARGVPGHHLFVRAGGVEVRAVADADDFRDDARLRDVVGRFDLDALSKL